MKPLYALFAEDEPVSFFARNPQDVVGVISHYHEQTKAEGKLNSSEVAKWVNKVPSIDEVVQVEFGRILYHVGLLSFSTGDAEADEDLFCERMLVTSDFEMAVSPESVGYFDQQRKTLPSMKRVNLYKFNVPGGLFSNLNFIPEDIMRAIVSYDISPHLERANRIRKKTIVNHPNIVQPGFITAPDNNRGYN